MQIREWLREVMDDPRYRELIWWYNEKRRLISIYWKHASYDDYKEQDSELFKKWAKDNSKFSQLYLQLFRDVYLIVP